MRVPDVVSMARCLLCARSMNLVMKYGPPFLLSSLLALSACGDDGPSLPTSTAAELAQESAEDYADNTDGLITGSTLAHWVSDWDANHPAGIDGDLILLHIQPGANAPTANITPSGEGVHSYAVPQSELLQVRHTGLSNVEAMVPEGALADAFLTKYGIDPTKDLVVFVFQQVEATTNSIVQQLGRGWLFLRYWGVGREHLALLNGSIEWNAANEGLVVSSGTLEPAPGDGTVSVRELRVDNTALIISLGEVLDILLERPEATLSRAQARFVDARGGAESLGLRKSTNTGKTDCTSYTGMSPNGRCSPAFEGRIVGAHTVPWTRFVDSAANGFRILPKATVEGLFDELAGDEEDLTYIQYCRTNTRSQVTGIVSALILGRPTRFYDTSFIEWSHLAHGPTERTRILPADSPFRTDLPELTEHNEAVSGYTPGGSTSGEIVAGTWVAGPNYNLDEDISATPIAITPNATTSNQIRIDDRAYKLDP